MQLQTIQSEAKKTVIYINEKFEIYYENQILYDFDEKIKINKFIKHKHRNNKKLEYLCVNIQSLEYKSKNITVPVEYLEKCTK